MVVPSLPAPDQHRAPSLTKKRADSARNARTKHTEFQDPELSASRYMFQQSAPPTPMAHRRSGPPTAWEAWNIYKDLGPSVPEKLEGEEHEEKVFAWWLSRSASAGSSGRHAGFRDTKGLDSERSASTAAETESPVAAPAVKETTPKFVRYPTMMPSRARNEAALEATKEAPKSSGKPRPASSRPALGRPPSGKPGKPPPAPEAKPEKEAKRPASAAPRTGQDKPPPQDKAQGKAQGTGQDKPPPAKGPSQKLKKETSASKLEGLSKTLKPSSMKQEASASKLEGLKKSMGKDSKGLSFKDFVQDKLPGSPGHDKLKQSEDKSPGSPQAQNSQSQASSFSASAQQKKREEARRRRQEIEQNRLVWQKQALFLKTLGDKYWMMGTAAQQQLQKNLWEAGEVTRRRFTTKHGFAFEKKKKEQTDEDDIMSVAAPLVDAGAVVGTPGFGVALPQTEEEQAMSESTENSEEEEELDEEDYKVLAMGEGRAIPADAVVTVLSRAGFRLKHLHALRLCMILSPGVEDSEHLDYHVFMDLFRSYVPLYPARPSGLIEFDHEVHTRGCQDWLRMRLEDQGVIMDGGITGNQVQWTMPEIRIVVPREDEFSDSEPEEEAEAAPMSRSKRLLRSSVAVISAYRWNRISNARTSLKGMQLIISLEHTSKKAAGIPADGTCFGIVCEWARVTLTSNMGRVRNIQELNAESIRRAQFLYDHAPNRRECDVIRDVFALQVSSTVEEEYSWRANSVEVRSQVSRTAARYIGKQVFKAVDSIIKPGLLIFGLVSYRGQSQSTGTTAAAASPPEDGEDPPRANAPVLTPHGHSFGLNIITVKEGTFYEFMDPELGLWCSDNRETMYKYIQGQLVRKYAHLLPRADGLPGECHFFKCYTVSWSLEPKNQVCKIFN